MTFDPSTPIDERYPNDMALQAIDYIQGQREDWIPRNAAVEVVLIEAQSLAASDVANAANQAVSAYVELLLSGFYQVPRLPGASSVGEVTVTFDDTVTTTIPAGTGFRLSEYGIEVATTAAVDVTAATSAVLEVASVEPTTLINGVGAGAAIDILDIVPNISTVAVSGTFANGADPEDTGAYTARAQARLRRVTNSLVVPDHFSAYVLEDGRASNALTIGAWDGDDLADIGTIAGSVTVVTYGKGGNLSSTVRDELAAAMQAITAAGVTVYVIPADVTTVNVTLTVGGRPGFSAAEIETAAIDAVTTFLRPETWTIGADVLVAQIEAQVAKLDSVDYCTASLPAADVTIPADGVAVAGTISVAVV